MRISYLIGHMTMIRSFRKVSSMLGSIFVITTLLTGISACVTDPINDLSDTPRESRISNVTFSLKARDMGSIQSISLTDLETSIVTAVIYLYHADTGKLYRSIRLEKSDLTMIIPPNEGMAATYRTEAFEIDKGYYDIFVLANFNGQTPTDEQAAHEDYFKTSTLVFLKNGSLSSIPLTGLPMSSRANGYLQVYLAPIKENKYNELTIDLERIYSKVTISIGELSFDLNDTIQTSPLQIRNYAKVSISSYWFINLMKRSYDFRHVAKVGESITAPPSWLYYSAGKSHFGDAPWEEKQTSDAQDNYIIDPGFFYKTLPTNNTELSEYYYNNIGSYSSDNIMPDFSYFNVTAGGFKPASLYILENTAFRTSQKWAYSPGILFGASVQPMEIEYYEPISGSWQHYDKPDDEIWTTLYLYRKHFFYDLNSVCRYASDSCGKTLDIDVNKDNYSDQELATYGIKQLKKLQGSGVCYYVTWIRHLKDAATMGAMKFGVVRNTHYQINVSKVTGLGASEIVNKLDTDDEPYSYYDFMQ